jgi:hypothetical protein
MMPILLFAAEDPGGWTRAKWGMKSPELIKLFQGEVTGETPRLSVPSYEVAGTKFRVLLIMDKEDRLDHVSLSPISMADCTDQLFQSVQELLVQKYGRPWKSDEAGTTEFQWTFPTTVITLSRMKSSIGAALISVRYQHRADADKM